MRRAIFLDRDGVINYAVVRNGKPFPPATLEDFVYIPGVEDSIKKLRDAGFLVIIVTNQPDVATGVQSREVVESMHQKLIVDKLCDDIRVCYHTDKDRCSCRKPKPGMLIEAAALWGIDLNNSILVGDRWRDIQAGKAVNCFTYFIDYKYQEKNSIVPDLTVPSLAFATKDILRNYNSKDFKNERAI